MLTEKNVCKSRIKKKNMAGKGHYIITVKALQPIKIMRTSTRIHSHTHTHTYTLIHTHCVRNINYWLNVDAVPNSKTGQLSVSIMWLVGIYVKVSGLRRDISVRQHSKKVSIELPATSRHRRDMIERLLKATLSPNQTHKQTIPNSNKIFAQSD